MLPLPKHCRYVVNSRRLKFARQVSIILTWTLIVGGSRGHSQTNGPVAPLRDYTSMVAHWADYADPDYLPFVAAARPELVQFGFYGAHFWSLAHTPHGAGYPAHFPVVGHQECARWFRDHNVALHREGTKVIGHFNVKFLVGDPTSDVGPRGFFDFYENHWDVSLLGPKPVADPRELLEVDRDGKPISNQSYSIGGMREYWACLNNPAWREVLKAWVRFGIAQDVDGFIVNYFYRHDCHCSHCVAGFRSYLGDRFTADELRKRFNIDDINTVYFDEIGAWHDPKQSNELKRESLRFSQIANKAAFDEVFVDYGRSLKADLIVAQWNHLGDFDQISGDERCMLPSELWAANEDYLWYSTGDAANKTRLADGVFGEATLQARYIRHASGGKPFTLGKYEHVRVRTAIAELIANGGMPMGFYANFKDVDARRELIQYYQFLHRYDTIYRNDQSHAETALVFPRSRVHAGDVEAVQKFKSIGRRLLDAHLLFDVIPDDAVPVTDTSKYQRLYSFNDEATEIDLSLKNGYSRFDAPQSVRVSASQISGCAERVYHFVNYNRVEPADGTGGGQGAKDEQPIAVKPFHVDLRLLPHEIVRRVEFLTPEQELPIEVEFTQLNGRVAAQVPTFLVYGALRLKLDESSRNSGQSLLRKKKVAAIVTEYRHNSHADIILSRLLQTDTLDGQGRESPLELVSLYVDQHPPSDTSRMLAASHRFRLSPSITDALTLGGDRLAVDGVLLIAEHGDYPRSPTGNIMYPKRRFWDETLQVFDRSRLVVPVFIDKHLSDNWRDAKHIYDTAAARRIPLMAGSSVPGTWRRPAADVKKNQPLREIVMLTYHTTDAYGFHALEAAQALAEQRANGETGVRSVRATTGAAFWKALEENELDRELITAAWERLSSPRIGVERLKEVVAEPVWYEVLYNDGLRLNLLELNGAVNEWASAWRYADGSYAATLNWTQEGRPGMHFTLLLRAIEQMIVSGQPTWNAERTLLTSGTLDALLQSRTQGDQVIATPYLDVEYQPLWRWADPTPPPPMRPWSEQ